MKVSELRRAFASLASGLSEVGARAYAASLNEFAAELAPFNKRDVSELLSAQAPRANTGPGTTLGELLISLEAFSSFVELTAKPSVRAAINHLSIFLNDRREMTIRSYVDALHAAFCPDRPVPANDVSLIDAYVSALREAKHDDKRFPRLFEALSVDERLSKDDVVAIANGFAFKMAKSTSKKLALERIWKMHNASEAFAAKSRASKGKSAA